MAVANTNLKFYFPMIRTRKEVMTDIQKNPALMQTFTAWEQEDQEYFLDFCTGVKGVKVLYDAFFKEVMNPEITPERLEGFLSELLHQKVEIVEVLPGDSTRISDECSLLIMDILVRLADGSYCNIEVQRIGYAFPGQRCACYSADLLLRQYKAVRGKKKKKFTYRDVKGVYTIVLMEQSTEEFQKFPGVYRHCLEARSDTGLKLDLLQKYVFVPLDIFRESVHNHGINNKLDAWLAFLSMDDPAIVVDLITKYPEFKAMYSHIYDICLNVEKVMGMYSKELLMLDRNTVQYMVDEMSEKIEQQKQVIDSKDRELDIKDKKIDSQAREIDSQTRELDSRAREIETLKAENARMRRQLEQQV